MAEDYAGVYHWYPQIENHPAGNVTKLEIWTQAASGNIRMGLYNATTRGRMDTGTNEVAMANGDWTSVTLGTPVAVTLNQAIFVGWQASATASFYRIAQDTDGRYDSGTYTDFPIATLSEFPGSDGSSYRVRVYIA